MLSSKFDNTRAKRHTKENKRKSKKRKVEPDLRSYLSLNGAMLPGEKSEEVKMKIEQGDFTFNFATAQSIEQQNPQVFARKRYAD